MNRRILTVLLTVLLCCLLTACGCEHEWVEASCTAPRTCTKCEETEGEALGHEWVGAACETPETCSRCAMTRGEAAGHQWSEATCTEASACAVCAATQGEALGHSYGEWELLSTDLVAGEETKSSVCTVCQTESEPVVMPMERLHEDGIFLLSQDEFTQRFNNKLNAIDGNGLSATYNDFWKGWELSCGTEKAGTVSLEARKSGNGVEAALGKEGTYKLEGKFIGQDNAQRALLALIMTCDPSLSFEGAQQVATDLIEKEALEWNGIAYTFTHDDKDATFTAEILAG